MSGPDAVRGITFQHAVAIQTCIEALGDHQVASIRFEGSNDILDLEALDQSGTLVWAKQMRTRQEPYTWTRREIVGVIRAWFETNPPSSARFTFITDGQFGPSADELRNEIQAAFPSGQVDPETLEELNAPDPAALANLRMVTRAGNAGAILERAEYQTLRLSRTLRAGPDEVKTRIDALFRLISTVSGNADAASRLVETSTITQILEVDRPTEDGGWGQSTISAWLDAVTTQPPSDDLAILDMEVAEVSPESIRVLRVSSDGERSATHGRIGLDEVLREKFGFLVGGTGCGKSTSARLLESMAAAESKVCIAITSDTYLPSRLDLAIRDRIETVIGKRVSDRLVRGVLNDPNVHLIFDGATEISFDAQAALREELRARRIEGLRCSIILTGRDGAGCQALLDGFGVVKPFELLPLDHSQKIDLVNARSSESLSSDEALSAVARIDRALGLDAGDPLLFSMALSTWLSTGQFLGRSALYERFTAAFAQLAGPSGDEVVDAIGLAEARLLASGSRQADRFQWIYHLDAACSKLQVQMTGGQVLTRALDSGLLVRRSMTGSIAPRHDSFADYLTAIAMSRELVEWPDSSQTAWEEAIAFDVEIRGLDEDRTLLLCQRNPLLAARLARFDRRSCLDDPEAAIAEINALMTLLAGFNSVASRCLRIACEFQTEEAVCELGSREMDLSLDIESRGIAGRHLVSITEPVSPLHTAITLWASCMASAVELKPGRYEGPPTSLQEAVSLLRAYEGEVNAETVRILSWLPKGASDRLNPLLLDRGLEARVNQVASGDWGSTEFNLAYQWINGPSNIRAGVPDDGVDLELSGLSTLSFWTSKPPASEAWSRIKEAINRLVRRRWL